VSFVRNVVNGSASALHITLALAFAGALAACSKSDSAPVSQTPVAAASSVPAPSKLGLCAGCHGKTGISILPNYPNLAGQKPLYLAKSLRAYQTGERKNPEMKVAVGHLTPSEIEALSEYYAAQSPIPLGSGGAQ
jgi:cytochrome c553